MTASGSEFPWRVRIEHEGCASVRVERAGRTIRFDPVRPVAAEHVVLPTWNWPEHLDSAAAAVSDGLRPTIVAPHPVLDWLCAKGAVDAHTPPVEIDDVRIDAVPYRPIPHTTWTEGLRKLKSAVLHPPRAIRRITRRAKLPDSDPLAIQLTFPEGARLVHLNHALHSRTPGDWLDDAVQRFHGAEWLLVGVDYEETDAVIERARRFEAKHVIFVDLLGDIRRAVGLPTQVLAPFVDSARADGMDAYLLSTGASYRFE